MITLNKGDRVRARWFVAQTEPPVALAGVQMKFQANEREVVGVITHIRGDHPTNPTSIGVWIQPDEGLEIEGVPIERIVEVLK